MHLIVSLLARLLESHEIAFRKLSQRFIGIEVIYVTNKLSIKRGFGVKSVDEK